MSVYKYETHLHTSQGSACGCCSGAEQVENLKRLGYDGCFVTDHFFTGNTAIDRSLPWHEKVELFCQGYEEAKKRGDELGLSVFFGWEYAYAETEFLTYGLDKEFLHAHPELERMDLVSYAELVHKNGGFVVHAHPFREAWYINTIRLYPRIVDGVEVINASHRDERFNERAKEYAHSYGLAMTGGSDTHAYWDFPGGGIETDAKINEPCDYLAMLKNSQSGKFPRIQRILKRTQEYFTQEPAGHTPKRADRSLLRR